MVYQNNESNLKKVSGEWVQKSNSEIEDLDELKQYALTMIREFGPTWNSHTGTFLSRQNLSRLLYLDHLYRKRLGTPGVILEFGVLWGATLAQILNLRGIYEPYNHSRNIVGFDSFAGFTNVASEDGGHSNIGDYATSENYETKLEDILRIHEQNSPIPHIRKFELVKGDVSETVPKWIEDNQHAIVAMALFDLDVYQPTLDALKAILPRLVKGSILVFDELNSQLFPGETVAVREVLELHSLKLNHFPHQPNCSWVVWGE
jgi:hypothetical protein